MYLRHKTLLLTLLLIVGLLHEASATPSDFTAHNLVSLGWGKGKNEVGLVKVPSRNLAPVSLISDKKAIYLLDTKNYRIVAVDFADKKFWSIPLSSKDEASDFCVDKADNIHVLFGENQRVAVYSTRERRKVKSESLAIPDITPVSIQCDKSNSNDVVVGTFDGDFYSLTQNKIVSAFQPMGDYLVTELVKSTPESWTLHLSNSISRGKKPPLIQIKAFEDTLLSVEPLGVDNKGYFYLLTEEAKSEASDPENTIRYLRKYSPSGKLSTWMETRYSPYAYMMKEFAVMPSGGVLQMLPSKRELTILALSQDNGSQTRGTTKYEDMFDESNQSPEDTLPSEAPVSMPRSRSKSTSLVTRDEIIQMAKNYVNHKFKVTKDNITSSKGEKLGGKKVITPLVKPGKYTSMPYKWGGFDTPQTFDKGLDNGLKAGDKNTRKGGSSGAVGIDCSGFVSRLWKLKYKHGTWNLPSVAEKITWKELKPGDALNKAGKHVMVFSKYNPNGKLSVYEAAGRGARWRVVRSTHSRSKLAGYIPYRYLNIDETSGEKNIAGKPIQLNVWLDEKGKTEFNHENHPTLYYSIKGSSDKLLYLTVLNLDPKGERWLWLKNKKIEPNKNYQFPAEQEWTSEEIQKQKRTRSQLNLLVGTEHLEVIVTSKPIEWEESKDPPYSLDTYLKNKKDYDDLKLAHQKLRLTVK